MSVKIVVGAALAAFLAINIVGATAIFGGMNAFERLGNTAEAFTGDGDDDFRQANASPDFDRDDDDEYVDDIEAPEGFEGPGEFGGPGESEGQGFFPGGPGFSEGKGGKGGKGAWETAYAIENASIGIRDAEETALGEVSGEIVEAKLKGKDGFPHYEVEVLDGDGQLYEVLVGAENGEIVGRKIEDPEDSYEMSYLFDQASISRGEAEDAATSEFPGTVDENKLDDENGFAVWEIKTFDEDASLLHESKVNAQNGDILAYETKGGF